MQMWAAIQAIADLVQVSDEIRVQMLTVEEE